MYIPFLFKNKAYMISTRNHLEDYSMTKHNEIDMTLSGRYLCNRNIEKVKIANLDTYPSNKLIKQLIEMIRKKEKTNKEVIIGAGANGVLLNIIKILFVNGGNLVTPFYSFDQAEFGVTAMGGYTKRVYLKDFKINFVNLKRAIDRKTRMVYICNPNNPTGIYVNTSEILKFAQGIKIPIVVDESGIEFSNDKSLLNYSKLPQNLIILRSFSKAYGIAGLRIGYLVCDKSFKQKYVKNTTINEVTSISCQVALEMLKNQRSEVTKNIEKINIERIKLINRLELLGIKCLKSNSNIVMTETTFEYSFFDALEKNEISVVKVYDELNKLHMRIAIQDSNTNDKFIERISKILKNKLYEEEENHENIISYKL